MVPRLVKIRVLASTSVQVSCVVRLQAHREDSAKYENVENFVLGENKGLPSSEYTIFQDVVKNALR